MGREDPIEFNIWCILSSILDVLSFRGAVCDSVNNLVVENVRDRLSVSKQEWHNFDVERFNPKKLNEVEVGEKEGLKISQLGELRWYRWRKNSLRKYYREYQNLR